MLLNSVFLSYLGWWTVPLVLDRLLPSSTTPDCPHPSSAKLSQNPPKASAYPDSILCVVIFPSYWYYLQILICGDVSLNYRDEGPYPTCFAPARLGNAVFTGFQWRVVRAQLTSCFYPFQDLNAWEESDAPTTRAMGEPSTFTGLVNHCLRPAGTSEICVCLCLTCFFSTHYIYLPFYYSIFTLITR